MGAMRLISPSRTPRLRPRAAMTLVETMVVVVILGIVGGTIMSVLAKQQAFYRSTADVMDLRSQLRQGSAVLAADLRSTASGAGDIKSMSETSIEFLANVGNSVACGVQSANGIVVLPPLTLNSGATLTQWISRPARGDTVYMYSDPDTTSATDDTWETFKLDTLIDHNGSCNSIYANGSDAGVPSYDLKVSSSGSPISSAVRQGATIRIVRRVRYQIYQGADGWYLGYCTPVSTCGSTGGLQPVAGPFYTGTGATANSVLRFTYYDINGNVTATPAQVARISFVLIGRTRAQINISGMGKNYYTDSLRTDVAIRNRS